MSRSSKSPPRALHSQASRIPCSEKCDLQEQISSPDPGLWVFRPTISRSRQAAHFLLGMQQYVSSAFLQVLGRILTGPIWFNAKHMMMERNLPPIEGLSCLAFVVASSFLPCLLSIRMQFVAAPFFRHGQVTRDPMGSSQRGSNPI